MRRGTMVLLIVLACAIYASTAHAQISNPIVGASNNGTVILAATANGDIYEWCQVSCEGIPLKTWLYWENVFSGAGEPPNAHQLVGMLSGGAVLSDNGDVYGRVGPGAWWHSGNMFQLAGQIQQAPIISVAGICNGSYVTFVGTANGDSFLLTNGSWQYIGNPFGGGPTPTRRSDWGALKVKYR